MSDPVVEDIAGDGSVRRDRSRRQSNPIPTPRLRPLKIFESDPMVEGRPRRQVVVEVPLERLGPGPRGTRIEVVDYDATQRCYYEPVDLDHPDVLIQQGLDPNESDPRFHQQMVYAVAGQVIQNFEQALGRRIRVGAGGRLRIFPHAFYGTNAYYDPRTGWLLFGYFEADREHPGPNLPGQMVFTCLSPDIIAHETTHALVHGLRKYFLEPTNADVPAFHEGFSDIVAIFQHFGLQTALHETIQQTRTSLRQASPLVDLARQFGYATGQGRALRSAVEDEPPDPMLYEKTVEAHDRGSVLVAAVFDAFFTAYQRRIDDLIRISTGGTGLLPDGYLHPDLVDRVAREAAATADGILRMCIRAFDYLPPIDVTFGDFLRAMVTADVEFAPSDPVGQRAAVIDAFRQRGIYPAGVTSLAETSLVWEDCERQGSKLPRIPAEITQSIVTGWAQELTVQQRAEQWYSKVRAPLCQYARDNRLTLDLHPTLPIELLSAHSHYRLGEGGLPQMEIVAQFEQHAPEDQWRLPDRAGVPLRGGTTIVASSTGRVRYVISKPLEFENLRPEKRSEVAGRMEAFNAFLHDLDAQDAYMAWSRDTYLPKRGVARLGPGAHLIR